MFHPYKELAKHVQAAIIVLTTSESAGAASVSDTCLWKISITGHAITVTHYRHGNLALTTAFSNSAILNDHPTPDHIRLFRQAHHNSNLSVQFHWKGHGVSKQVKESITSG